MNSGLYTAYSGLRAQMDSLDLLANNLANVQTAGFKEQRPFFSLLGMGPEAGPETELNAVVNSQAHLAGSVLNFIDGPLLATGRPLDVAIVGTGFLAVQAPNGIRYSRNGSLSSDAQSQLVTADGFPVLGEKGLIRLGAGEVEIGQNGEVFVNHALVDRLRVVALDNIQQLQREGHSLFALPPGSPDPRPATEASIRQGYIEQSNVNPVAATVRMVEILRHFEAIQKSLNLISNVMDAKAIDKLTR